MKNNRIKLLALLMACLLCLTIALVACGNDDGSVESDSTPVSSDKQTDPADTDPADTDPVDTDPTDTDPADTGSADTGTVDTSKLTVGDDNGGDYNKPNPIF